MSSARAVTVDRGVGRDKRKTCNCDRKENKKQWPFNSNIKRPDINHSKATHVSKNKVDTWNTHTNVSKNGKAHICKVFCVSEYRYIYMYVTVKAKYNQNVLVVKANFVNISVNQPNIEVTLRKIYISKN